ncbi:cytochrome-c oxidase, cbb3-type subunit III [Mangrovicella endophytica]|uniref:cytochrome-c oxidase, cbb3-type subunit III n=1 Tax=Mangrovicella endophytica TaxID=2066697 RepID=UPI000C9DEEBC|nr:cytochrome-c oxidase, cbb3-type subunit III [Mangrovicella endophytica]
MADREIDEPTGTATTGHSWDGIRELDTPMPRWWLWTFYATIVFAVVYMILYPAIPMIDRATQGLLGWSSRGAVQSEIEGAIANQADYRQRVANAATMQDIINDQELFQFAVSAGKSAFSVNCVQCHGMGAAGGPGYPNLQDDDWLWGGSIDDIRQTIAHGIRSDDPETRVSEMPAFGRDGILDRDQIRNVSAYVMNIAKVPPKYGDVAAGEQVFTENCAACHGDTGQGMPEMGAPALNDPIWLRVTDQDQVVAQVTSPKHGVMPAWEGRLGDTTVKELATYVYSLSGGPSATIR